MKNRKWNLAFWTTGNLPSSCDGLFGCSSHGLGAKGVWMEPDRGSFVEWNPPLEGSVLAGTFEEVAASLNTLGFDPALLLVFASIGTGQEAFLGSLRRAFSGVPVAGGCAARLADRGELIPEAPEAILLAVRSGSFEVLCHNVLEPSVSLAFEAAGPRALKSLQANPDGALLPALEAFSELQRRHGKSAADHESITLSDTAGRNLHFHEENGLLVSGADLPGPGSLVLRAADPAAVASRLESLLSVPGTLLLGCAGLRGTLPRPLAIADGCTAAFLFGEIGPVNQEPVFGNLMVTTVRRLPS